MLPGRQPMMDSCYPGVWRYRGAFQKPAKSLLDRSLLLAFRAVLSRPHHHRSSGAFSISAPQNRRQNEARI
jgi:hypothetical protein